MNKFKLACCAPLLAIGMANAAVLPCEGFKITVNNKLDEQLVLQRVKLFGATIKTEGSQMVAPKADQVFTVSGSQENRVMRGEMLLSTTALPQKFVDIKFTLKNDTTVCELENFEPQGNLTLSKTRLPGGVEYNISE